MFLNSSNWQPFTLISAPKVALFQEGWWPLVYAVCYCFCLTSCIFARCPYSYCIFMAASFL